MVGKVSAKSEFWQPNFSDLWNLEAYLHIDGTAQARLFLIRSVVGPLIFQAAWVGAVVRRSMAPFHLTPLRLLGQTLGHK